MADDEELKAMGIVNNNTNKNSNTYKTSYSNHTNIVAMTIQVLAVLSAIIGVIIGIRIFEDFEIYAVGFITVILISSLFVYAIGEIIQKLQNIEENTRK